MNAKSTSLIAPRVHLNGDTKAELQGQIAEATAAISTARNALQLTCPNARNYYVIGPDAFTRALAEYRSRQERLSSVYDELVAIFDAIDAGKIEVEGDAE